MTLITNKFKYQSISRVEENGRRKYKTPVGPSVYSVTTILDSTSDKTAIYEWRKKVGEQKANQITHEAASRGTRMHNYLEEYIKSGVWPSTGSNPYAKQSHKMAEIILENAFDNLDEIYGTEVNLYIPNLYAGTADLVAAYKGNLSICDYKQTNKPKKIEWIENYMIQLCAYIEAHNDMFGTDISEGHIFMCSKDYQYQQFDLWPEDFERYKKIWWDRVYKFYETLS